MEYRCTGRAIRLTSSSIKTERLFNKIPAVILVVPMVNHSVRSCTWWPFQTRANTKAEQMVPVRMAAVETHPESLFCLPGKIRLIKKASSGMNTAASVNFMVRVSIDWKNSFNVYVLVRIIKAARSLL